MLIYIYGNNEEIISDCLEELESFIELVKLKEDDKIVDEFLYDIGEDTIKELVS